MKSELVHGLRDVCAAALERAIVGGAKTHEAELAAIEAVLSALASKGVDGMPSVDEVRATILGTTPWDDRSVPEQVREALVACLAPIFAAKDAERDALRARVAELEARANALPEALREFRDAVSYVPDYFREKWGYDATLAKLEALLPKSDEGKG